MSKPAATSREFPDRLWAVEACAGIGRHVAPRLVADGETVLDVPPKLSARVRVFDTGQGRKTDPVDARPGRGSRLAGQDDAGRRGWLLQGGDTGRSPSGL